MNDEKLQPIHPGEVLLEEFLKPMELSQKRENFATNCLCTARCGAPSLRLGRASGEPGTGTAGEEGYVVRREDLHGLLHFFGRAR